MKRIFKILLGSAMLFSTPLCLTSCFGAEESKEIELTGIKISIDPAKSNNLEVDQYATITCSYIPENANRYKGEQIESSNIVFEVDGEKQSNGSTYSFCPRLEKDYKIKAYYCLNDTGCKHEDEFSSNELTITGFLKDEDRVVFKCYPNSSGGAGIGPGKLFRTISDMVIPAEVDGHKITYITNLFNGCKNIRTLRFDKNLSRNFEIGEDAFKNCSNLKYVSLPYQITTVGQDAFTGIDPEGKIFVEATSKPSGFYDLYSTSTWNGGRKNVYYNCKDFLETDDFVYGVSSSDDLYLVESKTRNSDIVIPTSVEGKTVTSISRSTFSNATYLRSVKFPDNLKTIGSNAFYGCTSLSEVHLPSKLEEVGESAFENCSNLQFVVIPISVTTIDENGFNGLNQDVAFFVESPSIPSGFYNLYSTWTWNGGKNNSVFCNCKDYYIDGDFVYGITPTNEYYLCKYFGRTSNLTIPGVVNDCKVTKISKYCFNSANYLTSVIISENIKTIEKYAFNNCISLESVKLPESLETLGEYVFQSDSSLTKIIIPLATVNVGERCFYGCSKLEIYVCSASRPSGFVLGGLDSYNWNAGVKMTYWGVGNGWFLDEQGNPYHL